LKGDEIAFMYWARSNELGSGQFRWLMLPRIWATDSYSCSSIHWRISDSTVARCLMPWRSRAEASVVTAAPAMSILRASVARCTPLVAARSALTGRREWRSSAGKPHGHGRAQQDVGHHLEVLQVDVRLVKPVEQHQAVGARLIQALGHVGEVGEERAQLDRHRDGDLFLHRLDDVHVGVLDFRRGRVRVGRDGVDVELQGIGSGPWICRA
jgi:hypothetical protein